MTHSGVTIGLRHTVVDGLRARLEFLFQIFRPASGPHQLDHVRPELLRVRDTMLAHFDTPPSVQKDRCPFSRVNLRFNPSSRAIWI
ncbi:hypothetical protein LMG29542_07900 [Paraburkholderia humisilvae]|uniref:Uncharacterized protein n=1 Tax=Paraburkholderia humisilvae TaxID=627669 RepID=A0A6J5F820_9BURK|nr:hypothetical protein LMG29542_07900 [Paraburkholderia humisilvae]